MKKCQEIKIKIQKNMPCYHRSISSYFLQFQKKSIFYFRFRWRYVLVDNRLPYNKIYNDNQTPVLLYGKYRSNDEFWVSLIEKAYAKLHGSDKMNNSNESDKLWNILLTNLTLEHNNKNNNYRHTGILAGHAYSILDIFEISKPRGRKRKKNRLIRIRNPWGRKEWKME